MLELLLRSFVVASDEPPTHHFTLLFFVLVFAGNFPKFAFPLSQQNADKAVQCETPPIVASDNEMAKEISKQRLELDCLRSLLIEKASHPL